MTSVTESRVLLPTIQCNGYVFKPLKNQDRNKIYQIIDLQPRECKVKINNNPYTYEIIIPDTYSIHADYKYAKRVYISSILCASSGLIASFEAIFMAERKPYVSGLSGMTATVLASAALYFIWQHKAISFDMANKILTGRGRTLDIPGAPADPNGSFLLYNRSDYELSLMSEIFFLKKFFE